MQPNSISSISVNSSDWAFWLDSIVRHPHQHKALIQVGNDIQFLGKQDKEVEIKREFVRKLAMDQIIEITQRVWNDPGIKQVEKKQILNGICYLHHQRRAKYQCLFWLVRIFAKFRGVEAQLRMEMKEINRFKASLNSSIGLSSFSKIGTESDEKVQIQLEDIQKKLEELASGKDRLRGSEKEQWNESFFCVEKQLYQLRQNLSSHQLLRFEEQLKKLDHDLNEGNGMLPRLKEIGKAFGNSFIRASLKDTLTFLCSEAEVTSDELARDQALFQCSEQETQALYVKRLVKAERTGLSLSLVTAIERTWKEIMRDNPQQDGKTKILDGHRVIFIPKDGEIYLKEAYISKGSYKASFVITPFHSLETYEDRGNLVILQAIQGDVLEEIEEAEREGGADDDTMIDPSLKSVEGVDQAISIKKAHQASQSNPFESTEVVNYSLLHHVDTIICKEKPSEQATDQSGCCSETVPVEYSAKGEAIPSDENKVQVVNPLKRKKRVTFISPKKSSLELRKQSIEESSPCDSIVINKKIPQKKISGFKWTENINTEKKEEKTEAKKAILGADLGEDKEEDKSYKQEAENCLLYGKLPGIWRTHKVTTIDNRTAIIQPIAGYPLKTTSGEDVKAISLEDMCSLFRDNLLAKNDQLVFLKMVRDVLTGVESLHKIGVMHRDLKPQNILCASQGIAAVSDLGTLCTSRVESALLNLKQSGAKVHNPEKRYPAGTPYFIPPEVQCYRSNIHWTKIDTPVDIWAMGLILWDALSGESVEKHPVLLAIGNASKIPSLKLVGLIGELLANRKKADHYMKLYPEPQEKTSLAHLVWSCTRPDPTQRPSVEQVIERYEAWAKSTEVKMKTNQISSVREAFEQGLSRPVLTS